MRYRWGTRVPTSGKGLSELADWILSVAGIASAVAVAVDGEAPAGVSMGPWGAASSIRMVSGSVIGVPLAGGLPCDAASASRKLLVAGSVIGVGI